MHVALLAESQQDRFSTSPKDHVMTLGYDLNGAPNNLNPATSPESPPLCVPCCCAMQTGCTTCVAIFQMYPKFNFGIADIEF
jgi:hypothetical protein